MRTTLPLLIASLAVLAGGCSHDPRETRGHLEPGNSITVAQEALGQGGGGGGSDDGATIGVVPFVDYRAPNVPVMQDGVVDYLFVFSAESLDGESERDEHWIKVKVAEQSFTKAHRNDQKSLLNDAESGISRDGMNPRSARLRNPGGPSGQIMPRVRSSAGAQTTRVTVAEVDPGTGEPRVVGTQLLSPPASGAGTASAAPNINDMLQRFNEAQQKSAAAAAAQVPPPVTPGASTPIPAGDTSGTSTIPGRR